MVNIDLWLSSVPDPSDVNSILGSAPEGLLKAHAVSKDVNSPRNDEIHPSPPQRR